MADRATTLSGSFMKVTLGATSKILGAGTYTISGVVRRTVETSEFGVDIDTFDFVSASGGTISLDNVSYDPTCPEQLTLENCALNKTKLINSVTSGIRFWINSTSYQTIGTSGEILMTDVKSIAADRNGVAKTSFKGQISGAAMYLI